MMDFSLKGHDVEIVDGDFALCRTDRDAIAQAVTMRLKTIAGEWFLDTNLGIPYLTEIFGHKRNDRFIRQLMVPTIEAVPGVKQIKDFIIDEGSNRAIKVSFTAVLTDRTHVAINESIGF